MYCKKCGQERSGSAQYCVHCGSLDFIDTKPSRTIDPRAIWNPNAAANWSVLLTPAFGSYLHMRNWRVLERPEQAARAKVWFHVSLALLVVYIFLGLIVSDQQMANGLGRILGLGFLFAWYFAAARAQAQYVKATFGKDYPKRPWGKTLLIAVACVLGYVVLAILIGFLFGFFIG
jgi:hypothetical protein